MRVVFGLSGSESGEEQGVGPAGQRSIREPLRACIREEHSSRNCITLDGPSARLRTLLGSALLQRKPLRRAEDFGLRVGWMQAPTRPEQGTEVSNNLPWPMA